MLATVFWLGKMHLFSRIVMWGENGCHFPATAISLQHPRNWSGNNPRPNTHTHTHTVGGCQMVPSWFLSPCDWCLINLILHCHCDGHISKMTQRLMQQGWQSREPQYSTVCSNHLIETEIGLAYVTDTFFPLKSVCKL